MPDDEPVLALTRSLMQRASVTPDDAGCQALLAERLRPLGFEIHHLRFGEVDNLWARRGTEGPLLVFAGHTDVVPTGPVEAWRSDPFVPTIREGFLYGRGAADMKGALAAMVVAIERLLRAGDDRAGSLGFLITSDEEGDAVDGTVRVLDWLEARGERIDWCVVGEPSAHDAVGDQIRVGRRGSLGGRLVVRGIQGHVAYPEQVRNPIHEGAAVLAALAAERWDDGDEAFPATSFQVSNVHAGTGAGNVVPATLEALVNFRFNPASPPESLQARVEAITARHCHDATWHWTLSGPPFVTRGGPLREAADAAIRAVTGHPLEASTSGGTSDGRFIAPRGTDVVEVGPGNATIHKVDECVRIDDLPRLAAIYEGIADRLLPRR